MRVVQTSEKFSKFWQVLGGIDVSIAQLHTPAEAAKILKVRESWLRTKAAARAIPCTFLGKHLRFSDSDISEIVSAGARRPVTSGW
jgi:excisionase family DNA binding protein